MAKPIIISTPEFSIRYRENVVNEIEYIIKGIDGVHECRLDKIKHKFIVEFLTGRKARRIFHIGCSARKWRNPIEGYDMFLQKETERLREEQENEAKRAETQKAIEKAKERQLRHEFLVVKVFTMPCPENWEELVAEVDQASAIVMETSLLKNPQAETSRKAIVTRMDKARLWNKRLARFLDDTIKYGWEVEIKHFRGYIGDSFPGTLTYYSKDQSLTVWVDEKWSTGLNRFLEASEQRLEELNKLYA